MPPSQPTSQPSQQQQSLPPFASALGQSKGQGATLDLAREAVVMEVKDAAHAPQLSPPLSIDQQINQQAGKVFVSPRVVDERAFEQLASTLRGLTAEAANQARGLVQAGEGVRTLSDSLRNLTKDLTARSEQAVKVLPLLEQRVASAQQLVDRVTRDTAIVKAREARDAIAGQIAEQTSQWRAEFVATTRQHLLTAAANDLDDAIAAKVQQQLQEQVQEQVQTQVAKQVHAAVEAAVKDAVREALRTLHSDVQETVQHAAAKAPALFPAPAPASSSAQVGAENALREVIAKADATRAALEAAAQRATATGTQLEQNVEAVAAEISQQLSALRSDALVIVGSASARIEGTATTAAEHAARVALTQVHEHAREQARTHLLNELMVHIGEVLEPEIAKQEAATLEAIETAQHAAHEAISTLLRSSQEAAHAAAERLGQVVVEARTLAHGAAAPAGNMQPAATLQASTLLAQLHEQTTAGTQLLASLSERVEAASHAADIITASLGSTQVVQSQQAGMQQAGMHPSPQQISLAIAQLTELLHHAAQAGQWLAAIVREAERRTLGTGQ